jgi:putative intracellular protease/amidase
MSGMVEEKAKTASGASGAKVRHTVGQVVWTVCAVAALFLAVGALLVAIKANTENGLVSFVMGVADVADLGVFDRDSPIVTFDGSGNRETSIALLNWGLAALCWLIIGKVLDRIIRPR